MTPRPSPVLHEHRDEFDERNLFLQLALGLGSASRRLDDLLARYGKGAGTTAGHDGDEALLHVVLGLIAFRDRVIGALAAARRPPPPARRRADADADADEVLEVLR